MYVYSGVITGGGDLGVISPHHDPVFFFNRQTYLCTYYGIFYRYNKNHQIPIIFYYYLTILYPLKITDGFSTLSVYRNIHNRNDSLDSDLRYSLVISYLVIIGLYCEFVKIFWLCHCVLWIKLIHLQWFVFE